MEGIRQLPDPNPELDTQHLTGADVGESFARLASCELDSLTVDGFRLLDVDDVDSGHETGITTVTCTDEAGHKHLFMYRPSSDSQVTHLFFED